MKGFTRLYQLLFPKQPSLYFTRCLTNASSKTKINQSTDKPSTIEINNQHYEVDNFTNITQKIKNHIGKNLLYKDYHPLYYVKKMIIDHFYKKYVGRTGNPIFSVYDKLNPLVPAKENFDSLLIPPDHVSRSKSDCYYVNKEYVMRSHMTAHQAELIRMGLDSFLMFGDVYRRDEVDSTHYPVFHQFDAVRLFHQHQLSNFANGEVLVFEDGKETNEKQSIHTLDAACIVEHQLKSTITSLVQYIFGRDIEFRWVSAYFPFTHPSWELEIKFESDWMEMLGCGIIRHNILKTAGAEEKIGWAFGMGLERLAMKLYSIPDIRLFWSQDSGFLHQFQVDDPYTPIKFKPVSIQPQCKNDISFWLPDNKDYHPNDFYELVQNIGGDIVEQIKLVDEFTHPKSGRRSHCYTIVYRHMERTLTQVEINKIHGEVASEAVKKLGVTVR